MTREEAIKVVKSATVYTPEEMEALETLIPELRESEDERIIKHCIFMLRGCLELQDGLFSKEQVKEDIAWLENHKEPDKCPEYCVRSHCMGCSIYEKQKSEKPLIPEKKNDVRKAIEEVIRVYGKTQGEWIAGYDMDTLVVHLRNAFAALEKQKEQIPYIDFVIKPHKGDDNNPYDMRVSEAQEYAIKRGFGVPFNDGEVYVDERHITQTIGNILRWADDHPKEQKPVLTAKEAWKEMRLEVYAQASGNRHEPNCSDDSTKMFSLCDIDEIFEKIGNSTVGSQPAEWSDKDEKMLPNLIGHLVVAYSPCDWLTETVAWLESLPERFNLQPKQEWSEEDEKTVWGLTAYIPNEELERLGITRLDILRKLKSLRPQPIQLKEAYKDGFQTARHAMALAFMNNLDENRPKGKMSLSNGECEDIDKAFKEGDWAKIMRYAEKYSPQPKQVWNEEDRRTIVRACVALRAYANGELPDILPSEIFEYADKLQSIVLLGSPARNN